MTLSLALTSSLLVQSIEAFSRRRWVRTTASSRSLPCCINIFQKFIRRPSKAVSPGVLLGYRSLTSSWPQADPFGMPILELLPYQGMYKIMPSNNLGQEAVATCVARNLGFKALMDTKPPSSLLVTPTNAVVEIGPWHCHDPIGEPLSLACSDGSVEAHVPWLLLLESWLIEGEWNMARDGELSPDFRESVKYLC